MGSLLFLAGFALLLAGWYRLPDLGLRPMHADEAILGLKFIDMTKAGHFDYNPTDFHGPVLHYLTWLGAKLAGWGHPAQFTEVELRSVVAITGILLVLSTLLISDALDRPATVIAMLLMAVSPMEVFYSRYYIMEVPFVLWLALFMYACWRFAKSERFIYVLLAGSMVGLLHATKETFVINLVAMGLGWVGAQFLTDGFTDRNRSLFLSLGRNRHSVRLPWLWVGVIGAIVSMALFSGGFRFWDDVRESFTTYGNYLHRSGGAGHAKPVYYYAGILSFTKDGPFVWTEGMILALAIVGMVHAFAGRFQRSEERKAFLVFLSIYTLSAFAAYSVIPYKTPWTILSVEHGLILLAGVGGQVVFRLFSHAAWKAVCMVCLLVGLWHLCSQSMFSIRDRGVANLRGPYVYSHTSTPALKLVQKLRDLAAYQDGSFSAQVINADQGWPLPWYLRQLPSVGYQASVPDKLDANVLVVDDNLVDRAKASGAPKQYQALDFYDLRPGVHVVLLVEQHLLKDFLTSSRLNNPP